MNEDTNAIIRAYLLTKTEITGIVGQRIHCPRLPENETLPALSFFTRGGLSNPYIPGMISPSVQFDCWGDSPISARRIYRSLYESLQGIENISVVYPTCVIGSDGNDYNCILNHAADNRNKPITGALTATYWAAAGSSGVGSVWVKGANYRTTADIISATEEVQGQDLADEIPNYFRVLALFSITIKAK